MSSAMDSKAIEQPEQKNPEKIESIVEEAHGIDGLEVARHVLFALVVGVVCGLASVVLCICVGWAYDGFNACTWLIWLLPIAGVLEIIVYKLMKLAPDMTTKSVIATMRDNEHVSDLLAPGILLTTCMTILCGGSVGKEAGALQMGASLGSFLSKPFKIKSIFKKRKSEPMNNYVAGCGMAACFAALFFAPLGSCMFVLELTHFKKPIVHHVITMLIACFVAFFVASFIGIGDIIPQVQLPDLTLIVIGQCIVIGVLAALGGSIFDLLIKTIQIVTARISQHFAIWTIVGGLIVATLVTVCGWDAFTGTGGDTLTDVLHGSFGPWDFLIKALLTLLCLGFWFKGGEIMPSFCIGGLLGASCSYLTGGDAVFGAAIGVLAFFAAFSRCPFAAFLMGCEIFGWGTAPFLAVAIFVAYMFSYPVGMYGDGMDKGIQHHLEKLRRRALKRY